MKKQIYDEKNGLYYERNGDYYIPCLIAPQSTPIGIWGQRRREYLKRRKTGIYVGMQLSGDLETHLSEIDQQAEDMFNLLIKQTAEREGITEQLKAENQVEWVRRMNNIRERATEIINTVLIYA